MLEGDREMRVLAHGCGTDFTTENSCTSSTDTTTPTKKKKKKKKKEKKKKKKKNIHVHQVIGHSTHTLCG